MEMFFFVFFLKKKKRNRLHNFTLDDKVTSIEKYSYLPPLNIFISWIQPAACIFDTFSEFSLFFLKSIIFLHCAYIILYLVFHIDLQVTEWL